MAGPQEGVQRLQSALQEQQRAWQNGEISAKAQRRFDELDEQVGIRTKARMASQAARTAAVKIDSKARAASERAPASALAPASRDRAI